MKIKSLLSSVVFCGLAFGCSHSGVREPAGFSPAGAEKKPPANVDFQQSPPVIIDSFFTPPVASELKQRQQAAGNDMPYSTQDDPTLGHLPLVQRMNDAKSGTDLNMLIFNLSDRDVAQALVDAQARGVNTTVIIDHEHYCTAYPDQTTICPPKKERAPSAVVKVNQTKQALDMLVAGHVTVVASSPKFSITHVKSFSYVSNGGKKTLVVTSMNQSRRADIIRDFGVVTTDENAYDEYQSVFQKDLENAKNLTKLSPDLNDANLAWSPVNSSAKLVAVINSAPQNGEIDLTVEEFMASAVDMINALLAAAKDRHVAVRIMTPLCQDPTSGIEGEDTNFEQLIAFNKAAAADSLDLDARGLRGPPTPTNPYLHQKMIVVRDGDQNKTPLLAYVGSINYSKNSLDESRELGIILVADHGGSASQAMGKLLGNFNADWNGRPGQSQLDLSASAQALKITEQTKGLCEGSATATAH